MTGPGVRGAARTRGCVHLRGGYCTTHGARGNLIWRPARGTTRRGGRARGRARGTWDRTREYYYDCDVGPTGRRMTQQRLSFGAIELTQEDNSEHPDSKEDVQDVAYDFTTTTGGSNRAV